jgi:hypothetical protein
MAKPETLKRVLNEQHIDAIVVEKINGAYENVNNKSPKKKKAEYLFHAVNEMDRLLDKDTRQRLMESCACTIDSSGLNKTVAQFASKTKGLSLMEKIAKLGEIDHLGKPALRKDGTILVDLGSGVACPCPQIAGVEVTCPISFTYCMCCGGHLKFHYENALGTKLDVKIKSSILQSMGKKPCVFILWDREKKPGSP